MLKIQEIRELIKLIDKSSIDEFKYENDGETILLKKNEVTVQAAEVAPTQVALAPQAVAPIAAPVAQPAPVAVQKTEAPQVEAPAQNDANLHKIESPMVGTFYASPTPDQAAYVAKGDKVSKDSIVCIVEAMKLFNEIEAEVNGEIVEILVENGQLVEYGQPLFLVKAE
ncbi:acetyl-CoA carboxylase biotin carboxyl carrier protein subunit [Fictibacillus macauensis ZFHKF-1]|uniref:Biotin carboxyl carrier protein of acetyl-CoA carboxylase n=1 Tax=Fictibacillus macauensis ZFHKF-1 TaxID=1196324 RepID=I8ANE9_9BACL|nr:acetyl-CoA carboxylase biotin carboxyl carrier protein [Fictibacillus macauensis]EIT87329.1 acetyl-CoA carboxylase biotin carboxyl carrier protein subunit [Fictibacillus macauensis ZFHKF-1]